MQVSFLITDLLKPVWSRVILSEISCLNFLRSSYLRLVTIFFPLAGCRSHSTSSSVGLPRSCSSFISSTSCRAISVRSLLICSNICSKSRAFQSWNKKSKSVWDSVSSGLAYDSCLLSPLGFTSIGVRTWSRMNLMREFLSWAGIFSNYFWGTCKTLGSYSSRRQLKTVSWFWKS